MSCIFRSLTIAIAMYWSTEKNELFMRNCFHARLSWLNVIITVLWFLVFHFPEDVSVLSHASLLTFSSFVNQHTIEQIALKLGVQKSVIHSIKTHVTSEVDGLREPIVVQNYHMLWSWRGRKATKKMVEQLLNVLRGINRWELAVVVSTAYKEHRRMRMSDFKWTTWFVVILWYIQHNYVLFYLNTTASFIWLIY